MSQQRRTEEQNKWSIWQLVTNLKSKFKDTVTEQENSKKAENFCCQTLCDLLPERRSCLVILFIIFSVIVPFYAYYYWIHKISFESDTSYTCIIEPSYRVPCGLNNHTCSFVSCCYDSTIKQCYHRIPAAYNYKKLDDSTYIAISSTTPLFTTSVEKLMLTIRDIDASRTQIILHETGLPYKENVITEKDYIIKKDETLLGIEVFRKATLDRLLTTFRGPLVASEGYWEWTFQLTNENLSGLGEIVFNSNETITKVIYRSENDHNTLPMFMAFSNGTFHGVVVEHQGLLEVSILPSKLIILKSLTGSKIILDLYVGGTSPEGLINRMRSYKPTPIPYWVLGAHICRDGLTDITHAIEEFKKFEASENTIHYTSDCIHENLYFMINGVAEIKEELKELIKKLQTETHFMLSITPNVQSGPLRDKAAELDLLYLYKENTLSGSYYKQEVVYPDYTHNSIDVWLKVLNASFPADRIDGFVLRDNWPVNENYQFINNEQFKYMTMSVNGSLSETIPPDAYSKSETPSMKHILKHNQYGAAQVNAFKKNFDHEFLMTSSYDYNLPEAALIQNFHASWPNLKKAITTTLYHSIFGSSLISIPICGSTEYYNENLDEALCIRWYILAATLPLFRISSEVPRRDPSNLATQFAAQVATKALERRFLLLPYFYTTLNLYNMLVKPMFYEFYSDTEVWNLDVQYMIGNALLVAHPVLPYISKLKVYLPPTSIIWYEFWGGRKYEATGWLSIDIVESDWVMFIRQGHIVPLRNAKNLKIGNYSPDDTYTFAAALNCNEAGECKSEGQLMLTSASLKLHANNKTLVISNVMLVKEEIGCTLPKHIWPKIIESVMVYGIYSDFVSYSTFKPIDLCETDLDEISIDMFM